MKATVEVYENMAAGDRTQLDWGGQGLSRAPLEGPEVNLPVVIDIPRETLLAGPGKVVVRYDIRDGVNNWSRLGATTEVEVGEDLLAAPRVIDAPAGVIDLVVLGDKDVQVQTLGCR